MNAILHEHLDVFCTGYLDNILIFSKDPSKHDEQVRTILRILVATHLYVKAEKCEFSVASTTFLTTFLGHVVKTQGFHMDPAPALQLAQTHIGQGNPKAAWFCDIIPPLHKGLYVPGPPHEQSHNDCFRSSSIQFHPATANFHKLDSRFASTSLLSHLDPSLPSLIETDSSGYAILAILSQTHPPPSNSNKSEQSPVAFYSQKLTTSELTMEYETPKC